MLPEELNNKRILVSTLNWGMGHVARTIGLMNTLVERKNTLLFAGNTHQVAIIKQYFPFIETCSLSDYPFQFNVNRSFKMALLRSSFVLLKQVNKEKNDIEKIVNDFQIDVIISDHRYGCYSKKCTSILLIHQLRFNLTGLWRLGNTVNRFFMRQFDVVWVPDYPDHRLSGNLSKYSSFMNNIYFIGPLSRFRNIVPLNKTIDCVIVLSGPDEYALHFAKTILLKGIDSNGVIIGKETLLNQLSLPERLKKVNSSDWKICDELILSSKHLISACGYSTLMDLEFLTCSAFLLPTPGQVEQEYLAKVHARRIGREINL